MSFLCWSMLHGCFVHSDLPTWLITLDLGPAVASSVPEICPQALPCHKAYRISREQVLCCRKWRVVSHPLNANPYLGSLLNYRAKLRLQEVTVENKTFVQLHCSFETEHEVSTL